MASTAGAIRAGRAYVEAFLDKTQLEKQLKTVKGELRAFGQQVTAIGQGFLAVGAVGAAGLGLALRTFADFGAKMSAVQAVTRASGDEFDALKAKAKELGATTSFTAAQAAEGMKFLGMAGFETKEILAGIGPVLSLARAGAVELGMASDIASDVSSAFGMTADEIGRVADVMALAAASGNVNIEGLGESFKFAAPAGYAAGQSIEEVTAALTSLGNAGLKGGIAGRNLAIIFKELANSEKNIKLKELGVEVADASGNFRDLHDIIADLRGPIAQMTELQRVSFLNDVFGEASKAAGILLTQSDGFGELRDKLDGAAGAAEQMAATMSDNLEGSFVTAMSAVEGVQIAIGEALEPTLRQLLNDLTPIVREFAAWIGENRELVVLAAKMVAGMGALGATLIAVGTAARVGAFAIGTFTAASKALVAAAGPLAVVGIAVAFAAVALEIAGARDAMAELNAQIEKGNQLSDRLSKLHRSRHEKDLEDARAIEDVDQRRAFLQEKLATAQREASDKRRQADNLRRDNEQRAQDGWFGGLLDSNLKVSVASQSDMERQATQLQQMADEFAAELENLDMAAQGAADSADAAAAGTTALSESQQKAADIVKGMQEQLDTFGLSAEEKAIHSLQQLGAAEEDLAEARRIAGELAAKEAEREAEAAEKLRQASIADTLEELQKEIDTFGMTDSQRKLFDLQQQGASRAELDDAEARLAELDALKKGEKEAAALASTAVAAGTFSSEASRMFGGTDDHAARTADATTETARNTRRLLRQGALAYSQ